MVEVVGQNQDVWQRVFPNEEQRRLAQKFVCKVSNLQSVKKVMAIEIGEADHKQQRLFILVEGTETLSVNDLKTVMTFFTDVCVGKYAKDLLGYSPMAVEDLFEEDLRNVPRLRNAQKTILWERPS